MGSFAWTQAKLPMIRKSRKSQSSTPVAFGTWSLPARSASTCDRVGISVNVKIVASSAHQKRSITKASQGTPGRKYWSVIRPVITIGRDRKSTRLNSSHGYISYAVFCLKKKKKKE